MTLVAFYKLSDDPINYDEQTITLTMVANSKSTEDKELTFELKYLSEESLNRILQIGIKKFFYLVPDNRDEIPNCYMKFEPYR